MKFNPDDEVKNDYGALKAGIYDFEVFEAEGQTSKTGNEMIKLTLCVYDSKGDTHKAFDYLVATPKALFKVSNFCEAVGLMAAFESGTLMPDDCVGRKAYVKLGVEDYNGIPKNVVKGYVATKESLTKVGAPVNNEDDIPF